VSVHTPAGLPRIPLHYLLCERIRVPLLKMSFSLFQSAGSLSSREVWVALDLLALNQQSLVARLSCRPLVPLRASLETKSGLTP
jgi:hypothetical protein